MIPHCILSIAISAVILISFSSVSHAEPSDVNEDMTASISFACAAWDELPYEEIFYRDGGGFQSLKLDSGRCSKLYPLKDAEALELHSRKKNEKGELTYELVGLAPLIKGAEQMLFLIEKSEESKGLPLLLSGLDDSWQTFPVGAFRFINFTPDPLKVTFGEKNVELPPSLSAIVKSQVPQNGGLISFYVKNVDGVSVYENRLFGQSTERQTVIIYPPVSEGRKMGFKFLTQRPAR